LTVGVLVACTDGAARVDPPEQSSATSVTDLTTPDTMGGNTADSTDDATRYTTAGEFPEGEVWQWAFGMSVFEQPLYKITQEQDFRPGHTDITMNTLGFSLTPDEQGRVVVVTLFNEDTGMKAYPGALPGGLDWSMTGADLLGLLGEGSAFGLTYQFTAGTSDGYSLEIAMSTRHEDELPSASIKSITVRPPNR
jgi:hypothetical protein